MIPLKATLRGAALCAVPPDVRYRRGHEVHVASLVSEFAGVTRDSQGFFRRGTDYVSRQVRCGRWKRGTGSSKDGQPGVFCALLGESNGAGVVLASEDQEVAALIAEVAALDAQWTADHAADLAYEARTQELVAHAVALEAIPVVATGPECPECGERGGHELTCAFA